MSLWNGRQHDTCNWKNAWQSSDQVPTVLQAECTLMTPSPPERPTFPQNEAVKNSGSAQAKPRNHVRAYIRECSLANYDAGVGLRRRWLAAALWLVQANSGFVALSRLGRGFFTDLPRGKHHHYYCCTTKNYSTTTTPPDGLAESIKRLCNKTNWCNMDHTDVSKRKFLSFLRW